MREQDLILSLREGAQAARRQGHDLHIQAGQLANAAGRSERMETYRAEMARATELDAASDAAYARAVELEAEADRREAELAAPGGQP